MAHSHEASYDIRWRGPSTKSWITATSAPTIAGIQALLDGASNVTSGQDPTTITPTFSAQHAFWAFKRPQRSSTMLRFGVGHGTAADAKFGQVLVLGANRCISKSTDGRENPFSLSYRCSFSIQGGSFALNAREPAKSAALVPANVTWADNITQIDNAALSPSTRTVGNMTAAFANGVAAVHLDPTGDEFIIVAPWNLKHASETGDASTGIWCEYAAL
jgi:hypothetical protein